MEPAFLRKNIFLGSHGKNLNCPQILNRLPKASIPFSEIVSIDNRNVAGIIPNSIEINTNDSTVLKPFLFLILILFAFSIFLRALCREM